MAEEYNRGLFHKWVPGLGMLLLIILFEGTLLLINPIYMGNVSLMSSSTGILAEYYMWGTFAIIIGLSLVLPFILRIKMRFRSKQLLITALVTMAAMSIIVAETRIGEVVVVASLIFGIAKMIGMVEMLLPIQGILSPDGNRKRFYAIFYPISIGSGQISTVLSSVFSIDIGWKALNYCGAATLLLLAMLCVIVMHNQRFGKKLPFIHIDWPGLLMFATALMSLAYIFSFGKQQDFFNSPYIIAAVVIVIASVCILVARQLTIKHPFLSFKLYKIKDVRTGLLLLVAQGMFMGVGTIMSIYTSAILGYKWVTNAELNLMTLPGLVLAGFVAHQWLVRFKLPIKMYIFSAFAAYFLYAVILYFMMVPELSIAQLYLPQILNGYGMCGLFISVWIYTFDKVPQNTTLPSVAPVMIFRSFIMMAFFTSLFGWLQYKLQWQSIGDLALYFDSLLMNHDASAGSLRGVQLSAILAANKKLLGYIIVAGLGVLTFILCHSFGRQKYNVARYRAAKSEKQKQNGVEEKIADIAGTIM